MFDVVHTWVPSLPFALYELDTQESLVNFKNGGHYDRNGEVFFDELLIQTKALFNLHPFVILVIPHVEFSIERQPLRLVLCLLQCEKHLPIFQANGA